jgi:N-acetylmuramoyl-L-alanine amidase
MHSYRNRGPKRPTTSPLRQWLGNNIPLATFFVVAAAGMLAVYLYFNPDPGDATAIVAAVQGDVPLTAPLLGNETGGDAAAVVPGQPLHRIGLIAGHKDNDSGAVCEDGLTEAEVNLNIAQQVAIALASQGVASDILAEFDPRLPSYQGNALISIHADSCDYLNDQATGFKLASTSFNDSSVLEQCILQQYYLTTGLAYHANTITPHMTDYHAFREIDSALPALIIEVGFMNLDREILTSGSAILVDGLVQGIMCSLEKQP